MVGEGDGMSEEWIDIKFSLNKRMRETLLNSLKVHADLLHKAGFENLKQDEITRIIRAWDDCMTMIFLLKGQDEDLEKENVLLKVKE